MKGKLITTTEVKDLLRPNAQFTHSKTGNVYNRYGEVSPAEFPDGVEADIRFVAFDSENKTVQVVIYKRGAVLFYIPSENPDFYGNTDLKVLYEREGIIWLRSIDAFTELVELNGQTVPRFQKVV